MSDGEARPLPPDDSGVAPPAFGVRAKPRRWREIAGSRPDFLYASTIIRRLSFRNGSRLPQGASGDAMTSP
jgi:hypothetical protein